MEQELPLSPEAKKIFTEEQQKKIEQGALKQKRDEDARSGKEVYYAGPEPEKFEKLPNETIERASVQAIKSKPKLFTKTEKEGPKDWYRRSEEKLENLNDRGPRLKV